MFIIIIITNIKSIFQDMTLQEYAWFSIKIKRDFLMNYFIILKRAIFDYIAASSKHRIFLNILCK